MSETTQEAWEVSTLQGDLHSREERQGMYRHYAEAEGHLCMVGHVGEDAPDARWYAWCANCRVGMLGTVEEVHELSRRMKEHGTGDWAGPPPTFATWIEARDWTRQHRASFGLDRQEVAPVVSLDDRMDNTV